ncbi:family 78 glycoside hydrolase catalytic domain [Chitinophaga sp.]|uniref:family 78 glycoside hydrolase catalytic domain n=1 Tax=Chitinophaga sp. TaxID=1869181 RepID=UPI0031CF5048
MIRIFLISICLGFIFPASAQQLFDDDWLFYRGNAQGAENPAFNDEAWRKVDLPHDWSIEDLPCTNSPFSPAAISQVSGGFTTGGTGWYRKHFTVASNQKPIILQFDGVYMNATVWLNGKKLGKHPYGYTTFSFDITDQVIPGKENVLAVLVRNEGENSRWYAGSGIYRHVWLKSNQYKIAITTPVVNRNLATVAIYTEKPGTTRIYNQKGILVTTPITATNSSKSNSNSSNLFNSSNSVNSSSSVNSSNSSALSTNQQFQISTPSLWSVDTPNLYTAVTIIDSDTIKTTFGIRTFTADAINGARLNDLPIKLKGGCVHHDNGPLGAKAYDRAEERKVALLKASGYNATRCAHNPPSPAFLDACDRLGMLVIDEAFDTWKDGKNPEDYHVFFNDWWQRDIESMVNRDRNHPSVIMWSIGNEIPHREKPAVAAVAHTLRHYLLQLDSTRLITCGVNGIAPDKDTFLSALDVAGYNYALDKYEPDHARVPDRVIMATESFPLDAGAYWEGVIKHPWVIGDFVWTAFDYIGEASIGWLGYMQHQGFYPWNLAYCGDIDICGWKRPQSYYRDALWMPNQLSLFVHPPQPTYPLNPDKVEWSRWEWQDVTDSWNWQGHEGKPLEVVAYSSYEQVELFLNGKSLGKKVVKDHSVSWQVPYTKGTLTAVGGKKKVSLSTTGPAVRLQLQADTLQLAPNNQDLAYITVNLLDSAGYRNPDDTSLINFKLEGPATIVGVGNADPRSLESNQVSYRKAFRGRALVIIKAGKTPGAIRLIATSPNLQPAEINFNVRPPQWIGYEEMPDSLRLVPGLPDHKTKAQQRAVTPLFRKSFTTTKPIKTAQLTITGLGHYELTINGKKPGNSFLAPGWTNYDKRVLYNTYDVTSYLRNGENTLGVIVGNGFYYINKERYHKLLTAFGYPKMYCQLQITYTDGSSFNIVSDQSWKTSPSPITFTSIYGGEDYDARLEQDGWDCPGFDDSNWKNALLVQAPAGKLEEEKDYPVTIAETIPVKSINNTIYDFGQNAAGIISLKIKGHKGQTIKLTPAELLTPAGLSNQRATGKPYYYSYTLKGNGIEEWHPRFTYYGFRYIQVEGATPDQILDLKLLHIRNSSPENGTFTCSNPLFNQIYNLIKWAIKSNLQSVATDCPHREKLGWLEQDYLMGNSIQFNYDIRLLYQKLVNDMIDAQTPEGLVPDIAPEYVFFDDKGFGFRDSPEWGSACVILPWLLYKWYGDTETMQTAYPMMQRYIAYLANKSDNHILSYGLGDWFDYGPARPGVAQLTPKDLTATAIYYYDCRLLADMATILKKKEANSYRQQANNIKQSFNNKFFNKQTKVYATGSQTSMAMPLCTGLVAEENRKEVFKNLVDSINAGNRTLTAGDIGFHFLIQALQQGGASQLIYDMNYRNDVPGYGYQIAKGATALTESWPALAEVSNNHLMLGHIMEWFYNGLAGIQQSETSVAYRDIIIRPEVVGDITHVKATYHIPDGTIRSEWELKDQHFTLHVSIPSNTIAHIKIPATPTQNITENGRKIKPTHYEDGRAIIKISSGEYIFSVY